MPANARYLPGSCFPHHVTMLLKHQADNQWARTLCAGCNLPSAHQPALAGHHARAAGQQWLRLLPQSAGGRHARPKDASPGKSSGQFAWKDSQTLWLVWLPLKLGCRLQSSPQTDIHHMENLVDARLTEDHPTSCTAAPLPNPQPLVCEWQCTAIS